MSTPTARRPNFWAARQVVAVPENGSRTVAGMAGALWLQVGRQPRVDVDAGSSWVAYRPVLIPLLVPLFVIPLFL